MICLIEIGCFWFWSRARPTNFRKIVSGGAIAASMMVVFATGSRSGLLGTATLAILLATGPGRYRVPITQIVAVGLLAVVAVATIVPADAWDRMINFFPERHTYGYHSSLQRLDTVELGIRMFGDHPLLGVGPGNFREVSRQIYHDPYFRPPHNAYLWALAETGVLGSVAFLSLFALAWREIRIVLKLAEGRDPELSDIAGALRTSLAVFSFFSLFADIWLSPIIYVLLGELLAMRRYLESPAPAPIARPAALRSRLAL
jgi:O-antigen ligase